MGDGGVPKWCGLPSMPRQEGCKEGGRIGAAVFSSGLPIEGKGTQGGGASCGLSPADCAKKERLSTVRGSGEEKEGRAGGNQSSV